MMILRGGHSFPYYDLGGAVENFHRKIHDIEHREGGGEGYHFFPEKEIKICCWTLL